MPELTGDAQDTNEREVKIDPSQALDWGDVEIAGITKSDDKTDDNDQENNDADNTEDGETDDTENNNEEVVEEFDLPEPVVLPEDPGTFTPNDYSFTVETLDGTKTKITTPEQAESYIDENADNLSVAQQMSLMRKTTAMENNLNKDKAEYDKQKEAFDAKKNESDAQQETINTIAAEINYLVSKGKLPQVDDKYATADWADPLVSKQAGVKEQVELLTYMRTENDARAKAGLKPLTSIIDAYNSMELEKRDSKDVDVKKKQAEARRAASSRVASSTPNPVNIAPKGIAVGRALALGDLESF